MLFRLDQKYRKYLYIIFIILFIIIINPFRLLIASNSHMVKSAEIDLNGDGKLEKVFISIPKPQAGDFILKVNEISIQSKLWDVPDGFIVVDVDTTDQYKEIAVHTPGPSADDEYLIFWYNGKSIMQMGKLSRWPEFLGNGIVIVGNLMGFWTIKQKYVLNKEKRILEYIPQELYFVGQEVTVTKGFRIYKSIMDTTIIFNFEPKEKTVILLYTPSVKFNDPNRKVDDFYSDWYLLKSETGIVGWARLKSFKDKLSGWLWVD